MEEAYSDLYQQFLRLRSLCLRQAALLHQLTAALKKQQGAPVPNGELSDMMSIPVQCSQDVPVYFHEKPQLLADAAHNPAAQFGTDSLTKTMGAFSTVLAEDMAKLSVHVPQERKDGMLEQNVSPPLSLASPRWQGTSSNECKTAEHGDDPDRARNLHTTNMPVTDSSSVINDWLSQSGGFLVSDVALQSHVCDFCEAVFPGDTTTRGEFLRHLHTHIT